VKLKLVLKQLFPDLNPARLPGGFDRVGDIAVIGITPEVAARERQIGEIILATCNHIRVVVKRTGPYEGVHRTLPLAVIAGEGRFTTVHRENGVLFHLDLARSYFSTRSAHERARIAALVQPGETVAVLGSGIGPFPLIIARHSQAREIVGIEINPVAHQYAERNLAANRSINTVVCIAGDAARKLPILRRSFDRILIAQPHGGTALLPHALAALRPGGHLHLYAMQPKNRYDGTIAEVTAACSGMRRCIRHLNTTLCGHCGPTRYRICLDAVIDATG
jgi:tRNA (guanine37-N1)-methyltransferase